MNVFFDEASSPSAKFLVFHYFIKWFIDKFGFFLYVISIVGFTSLFCAYALSKSINNKEWDKTFAIALFTLIAISGLIGLGIDVNNGYSIITVK